MADINVSMGVDNTGALKSLKQVETSINNLVGKFSKLKSVVVGVKVNTSAAMTEINAIQTRLSGLTTNVSGTIRLDNSAAIAAINQVQAKINSLNLSISGNIGMDNSEATDNINQLLSRLSNLTNQINDDRVIRVDTNDATRSVRNLGDGVRSTGAGFSVLGAAIAGLGLSQLIINANTMATTITNLSRATDIGMTSIKSYADAITAAGGDARGAVEDLTDLTKTIDEARNGNGDAQNSFAKLGISLSDLSKLSEEDIFKRTVQGLANVENASKRTTMSMSILGGEFKKVDIRTVAEGMNGGIKDNGASVAAMVAAAGAQKAMAENMTNLGNAILNLTTPLNKLVSQIDISTKAFEQFITIIGIVVGSLAALKVAKVITATMVAAAESVVAAGGVIRAMFGEIIKDIGLLVAAFSKSPAGISNPWWTRVIAGLGGLLGLIARFTGITGLIYGVAQALDFLVQKMAGFSIIEKATGWVKALKTPLVELYDIIDLLDSKLRNFTTIDIGEQLNISPMMKMLSMLDLSKLKELVGLTKELSKAKPQPPQALVREIDNEIAKKDPTIFTPKKEDKEQPVIDAQRGIRLELQKTLKAYEDQNAELSRTMNFSNELIGIDEVTANRKQKLFDIETNRLALIRQLTNQYEDMKAAAVVGTDEEKKAFAAFASSYLGFQDKINAEAKKSVDNVSKLLTVEERLKGIEQARLDIITQMVDAETRRNNLAMASNSAFSDLFKTIKDSKTEMEMALLSPLERQREEILRNARLIEDEMVKKLTEAFTNEEGDIIDPERFGSQINKARSMIEGLKNTQLGTLETSQTWASGWDGAFKEYADSATTAAETAKNVFETVTSAMEDMLKNFVRTGKLDFKSLAASIITTLTSKALTDSFKNLMVAGNSQFGGASGLGGLFGSLFGMGNGGTTLSQAAYAGISGFADGGSPPVGKISMVGERGPELFMPKSAGTIIPNHMLGVSQPQPQPIVNNYYNSVTVSAVDSVDAGRFIMANKNMIFAANETARRSIPGNQVRK
jgi:hypothetical protein